MLPLIWTPYSDHSEVRAMKCLWDAIYRWERTPYREGQQCPGYGADCVRFVCAVLDELQGSKTPIKTLPADTALHDPAKARAAMRQIMGLFQPIERVRDGTAQPGDVLITGPRHGGPGHASIVGPTRNSLWEATSPCVHRTGWSIEASRHNKLYGVLRMKNRSDRWVKTAEH